MVKRDVAVKAGNGKLFKAAKGSILLELNLVMLLLLLAAGLLCPLFNPPAPLPLVCNCLSRPEISGFGKG